MISGRIDLKSSGSKIKEIEHDVARKPLSLFGIMLWEPQCPYAVKTGRETVASGHQPGGERIAVAALPGCARQALMVCCRSAENE
ncbi:hypothetical protein RFM98_23275 [Mesorhizobium sp. VK9D]|uniref:hypothetical protein n=1 Tax=Mesorhizobium australafricanum TaxID=3072311 RepID=UPI002A23A7F4|nr:hypothetical protein [Mesorhizobium sp. VK9D]MDX8455661.1 hypothetical protein [Mesorhizobium sp. VK9D]